MDLKFCTGCTDREARLHAANMRPESLDEATAYILQYQFNPAALYGRREDRSPKTAVRSRRDYSEERVQGCNPVRNRAERRQNTRESRGEWQDYSPRQDRPPFKPPQERREVSPPGRSREAEPDQPELKILLESMMAGVECRLGRMIDDKLSNFASRIEGKVFSLSLRVKKMEDRIDKLDKSRRSPSPKTHSTSPLTCYGCANNSHFISQCPERGVKSVRFEDPKNGMGSDRRPDADPGTPRGRAKE
ncbi:hypothetical protein PoB_004584000 [Plakobranchus ocellatus]|uniref:CCHC-type domain-containing protein n=1 Tax=Plakobranchus ocellatus TaxID=259542 RepID=A0AAV4BJW8_9GAST|nr:hypothetical protein PoB_004584000 [Plakobranchus ocellatus]